MTDTDRDIVSKKLKLIELQIESHLLQGTLAKERGCKSDVEYHATCIRRLRNSRNNFQNVELQHGVLDETLEESQMFAYNQRTMKELSKIKIKNVNSEHLQRSAQEKVDIIQDSRGNAIHTRDTRLKGLAEEDLQNIIENEF